MIIILDKVYSAKQIEAQMIKIETIKKESGNVSDLVKFTPVYKINDKDNEEEIMIRYIFYDCKIVVYEKKNKNTRALPTYNGNSQITSNSYKKVLRMPGIKLYACWLNEFAEIRLAEPKDEGLISLKFIYKEELPPEVAFHTLDDNIRLVLEDGYSG